MRLQRFGSRARTLIWGADCARCEAFEDSIDNELRTGFIEELRSEGWQEDAKGRPLCPECAKAKGETTSE